MKIGDFEIGSKPFTIAEVGLNHNGSVEMAVNMIQAAKDAGVDCVKFQTFKADEFCPEDDPLYATFKQCELPAAAWGFLKMMCSGEGVIFLSTPQNRTDLDLLLQVGIPAIKVGSDDFCNLPLLRDYASVGLPLLLSTGMASAKDIINVNNQVSNIAAANGQHVAMLVCTSQYPTPPHEANLLRVSAMRKHLSDYHNWYSIGFSDHTKGNTAAAMAVALGAVIFEKHFTLDHKLPGPDHAWACEPNELTSWVATIHEAWAMRGNGSFELSEREQEQRRKYQRRPGQQLRGEA